MSGEPAYQIRLTKRGIHPRDLLRLGFMTFVTMLAVAMVFVIETKYEAILVGLAVLCAVFMMLPMIAKKNYCAFEPATVVLAVVLFSVTAKVWMILLLDNSSEQVRNRLLLGHDSSVLEKGLLVMTTGIGCFVLGYLLQLPRVPLNRLFMVDSADWSPKRLQVIALFVVCFSLMFFALFVQSIGFSMGDSLSAKRFMEQDTASSGRMFKLSYYYYRLAAFSKFAFYLTFVDLIANKRRLISLQGMLMGVAAAQSILLPIFLNNRAGVALLVIDVIVMLYFLRPRLVFPACVIGGLAMFSMFIVMLVARKSEAEKDFSMKHVIEETLGGRDLMDITKTAHIVNAIPHQLEYKYGETLWGWLAAPVPRSIWPEKPMWAERGPYLMHKVYGDMLGYSGIPPGLVAELYWNLGWFGVVIGMLIIGVLCQWLFKGFVPFRDRTSAVLIYAIIINRMVLFSFGNDLGTGVLKAALDVVPLIGLIYLVAKYKPRNLGSCNYARPEDLDVSSHDAPPEKVLVTS